MQQSWVMFNENRQIGICQCGKSFSISLVLQLNHSVPQNGHLKQKLIFPGEATLPKYIPGNNIQSSNLQMLLKHEKKRLFSPQLVLVLNIIKDQHFEIEKLSMKFIRFGFVGYCILHALQAEFHTKILKNFLHWLFSHTAIDCNVVRLQNEWLYFFFSREHKIYSAIWFLNEWHEFGYFEWIKDIQHKQVLLCSFYPNTCVKLVSFNPVHWTE